MHQPARSVHQADTRASDRFRASGYRAQRVEAAGDDREILVGNRTVSFI